MAERVLKVFVFVLLRVLFFKRLEDKRFVFLQFNYNNVVVRDIYLVHLLLVLLLSQVKHSSVNLGFGVIDLLAVKFCEALVGVESPDAHV